METTLHQQLKRCYAQDDASTEVVMGRYRIDAIRDDELIEVQCASLSAIRDKCQNLLKRHQLRVVKPVIMRTRIAKSRKAGGPITSRRLSPKRGNPLDVFDELIYFTRVFPHPNLVIEVPLIEIEQLRLPGKKRRRRWHKDFKVGDVRLEAIQRSIELRIPADLLDLLNIPETVQHFNTAELATMIDRPRWNAQQIAYVLRKTGAIDSKGRNRTGIIYQRAA
ncbi:MAG: hypothetical protein OSA98_11485 [Rubripirellula sp.]|jgi:hypothetical protein|nr:hypothetical protein [Rubripirellula sp.]|tara:strand:+ start:442 stop:1107 length:666 start_codon:yes stop_codon:yes gene_type:complete